MLSGRTKKQFFKEWLMMQKLPKKENNSLAVSRNQVNLKSKNTLNDLNNTILMIVVIDIKQSPQRGDAFQLFQ